MENSKIETAVTAIASKAPVVAAEYQAHQDAIATERAAEVAVLERLIAVGKPALRALSSKLRTSYFFTSGNNGCNHVERAEYYAQRGLVLVDAYTESRGRDGNDGGYTGSRLVLLVDGSLVVFKRRGAWSAWQGSDNSWEATVAYVSPEEAMAKYELDDVIASLSEALTKQARKEPTKKALERAATLEAVAKLIK